MCEERLNFFVNTESSHCNCWDDPCDSWNDPWSDCFPCTPEHCRPERRRPKPPCRPTIPCPCNPCKPANPCPPTCRPAPPSCRPCTPPCAASLSDLLNRYRETKVIFTIGTCRFAVIVCHSSSHFVEVIVCKTGKRVFFNLKKIQNVEPLC